MMLSHSFAFVNDNHSFYMHACMYGRLVVIGAVVLFITPRFTKGVYKLLVSCL